MQQRNRAPTPPGEILLEEFLKPMGITQVELAKRMGVPIQRVNELVNGKRGITAETAVLLSRVFGNTEKFWLNMQNATDLWVAHAKLDKKGSRAAPRGKEAARVAREKLEDKRDLAAARKALKEKGPNLPFAQIKKDLGL